MGIFKWLKPFVIRDPSMWVPDSGPSEPSVRLMFEMGLSPTLPAIAFLSCVFFLCTFPQSQ